MMSAYDLPTELNAGGQLLTIRNRGDWRVIIDVNIALTDIELTDQERAIASLSIFYDADLADINDPAAAYEEMLNFISIGEADDTPKAKKPKLIDWQDDAGIIVAGVNHVLQDEIRAKPYMHWWTFMAAFMSVGDSTLATVVGIRSKIARGKKLEKHEREFRDENPQYFRRKRDAEAEHNVLLDLID